MTFWTTYIFIVLYMILGAVAICCAVHNFNKKLYFLFGVWVMSAFATSVYLVKTIIQSML